MDTKNQLADILTKGNFTRDEWNYLLCLFNVSHFSSTVCSEAMAKKIATRFRSRTSHSEIATNDESYYKGSLESAILDVRKPGEEKLWKSRVPGMRKLREGNPLMGSDPKTSPDYHHEQSTESVFLSTPLKVG